MGGYCSNLNRHFIYLPEIEEEKIHGKTKTTVNSEGKIRVYNKRQRSKSLPEIDKVQISEINRVLRRRYSQHYENNRDLINKCLILKR